MASILATVTLGYSGASAGTVTSGVLTLAVFPRSDTAQIYETAPTVEPLRFDIATGRLVKVIGPAVVISF